MSDTASNPDSWLTAVPSRSTAPPRPWAWDASDPANADACVGDRVPERPDLGQLRLLGGEPGLLVESRDLCAVDLVDLEAEKVDRAGQGPRIASEIGETGVGRRQLPAGLRDGLEVRAGEPVERVALCRLTEQGLMSVLTVEIDEVVTELGQQ